MKIGATFPQLEIGNDPIVIRDFAQAVEGMGYDYLLAYDHVVGANPDRPGGWQGPYTHESAFHEIFVLFSFLAAHTITLELTTGIVILPQRDAVLTAKQAAQLDILSSERLRMGIAVGWNPVEMQALGYDFATRGQRIDEQIEVMKLLWTQPLVKFQGAQHTLDDVGINPMPKRSIPLWMGGYADVVMRRMAKYAQGWIAGGFPIDRAKPQLAKLHQYLQEQGRNPADFGVETWISHFRPSELSRKEHIEQWQSLGATHIALNTMYGDSTPDEHLRILQEFKTFVDNEFATD